MKGKVADALYEDDDEEADSYYNFDWGVPKSEYITGKKNEEDNSLRNIKNTV